MLYWLAKILYINSHNTCTCMYWVHIMWDIEFILCEILSSYNIHEYNINYGNHAVCIPLCSIAHVFYFIAGQLVTTFGCVVHDCLLDFFGSIESYYKIEGEKHLKIPNTMYLNISDQQLCCASISQRPLNDRGTLDNSYGNLVCNVRTTVYSGRTTSDSSGTELAILCQNSKMFQCTRFNFSSIEKLHEVTRFNV